jgi:membrane associated rhomboid family serine protease
MHLAFNMFSLFMVGIWFEHIIASWRFGMVYALGVLAGSFASIIMHRSAPSYMAVGASAGVSAVIGAATVIFPDLPITLLIVPFPMPAWVFGCLFIVYSVVFASRGADNVGHEAHLGGLFAGMTLIAAFYPDVALGNAFAIVAMLGAGAFGYAWRKRRML